MFSQLRTEDMVLYSLGRSPCSCLSLQWQPTSVKCFVSTFSCHHCLSSFPDKLDLITQMSSTFIKGKGRGKESEESCIHTPHVVPYMNVHEFTSAYAPRGVWAGMWEHPYTFPLTFLDTQLQMQLEGRTDLWALDALVADTCWRTISDLEDTPEGRVVL